MPNFSRNIRLLFLMEICAGLSRGSFLVCIGWTVLMLSDNIATVGQMYIVAMLTVLITAPFLGVVVDRNDRKMLAMLAHLAIALTMATTALAMYWYDGFAVFWLFATVAVVNLFRSLYFSTHDGLIHSFVAKKHLVRAIARFRTAHLLATVVGTIVAGSLLEAYSPSVGFLFPASTSMVLVLTVTFVDRPLINLNDIEARSFLGDLGGIWQEFKQNRNLQALTILTGVALPVGQLTNAILPSFIRDELGYGGEIFGIVDSGWATGGMVAALALSFGWARLEGNRMVYFYSALVGLSTIAFALSSAVWVLFLFHVAMGLAVWLCRIVINGRILEISTTENVGRMKASINIMFSFAAVVMCFSPTLVSVDLVSNYFYFWAVVGLIGTVLAYFWQARQSRVLAN